MSEIGVSLSIEKTVPARTSGPYVVKPALGNEPTRVCGLDSLRFIAALWVAFGHGAGLPLKQLLPNGGLVVQALASANAVLFNGVAAVVVFFVVSGFCIHYPFVRTQALNIRRYLIRRYVRIGGPLIVILLFVHFSPTPANHGVMDVVWSLYCELVYYTIYPILLIAFRAFGIKPVIVISTAIAAILIFVHSGYTLHWNFGMLTFLIGLPTWLLGCLLAEKLAPAEIPEKHSSIWAWRTFAWLYSSAAILGVFHSPIVIGFPLSMLAFSFYCYFWLKRELVRWRRTPPSRFLEWAGAWSYSLYLVHNEVIAEFGEIYTALPSLVTWAAKLTEIAVLSYAFFRVVEWPTHKLAQILSRCAAPTKTVAIQYRLQDSGDCRAYDGSNPLLRRRYRNSFPKL